MAVNPLNRNQRCVDDQGRPEQNLLIIIEQLRNRVEFLEPASGSGSPENIVEAPRKKTYMDDDTGDFYIKQLDDIGGDKSQGWVQI